MTKRSRSWLGFIGLTLVMDSMTIAVWANHDYLVLAPVMTMGALLSTFFAVTYPKWARVEPVKGEPDLTKLVPPQTPPAMVKKYLNPEGDPFYKQARALLELEIRDLRTRLDTQASLLSENERDIARYKRLWEREAERAVELEDEGFWDKVRLVRAEEALKSLRLPYVSDLGYEGVERQNALIDEVLTKSQNLKKSLKDD